MKIASRCDECGGQLTSSEDEVYCMKCGLVIEDESLTEEVAS